MASKWNNYGGALVRFGYVREPGQGFWIDGSSLQDMIGTLFGHAPHCCSAGLLGGAAQRAAQRAAQLHCSLRKVLFHCEIHVSLRKCMFLFDAFSRRKNAKRGCSAGCSLGHLAVCRRQATSPRYFREAGEHSDVGLRKDQAGACEGRVSRGSNLKFVLVL